MPREQKLTWKLRSMTTVPCCLFFLGTMTGTCTHTRGAGGGQTRTGSCAHKRVRRRIMFCHRPATHHSCIAVAGAAGAHRPTQSQAQQQAQWLQQVCVKHEYVFNLWLGPLNHAARKKLPGKERAGALHMTGHKFMAPTRR